MYSASQREVGEYCDSSYPESQCRLLETSILGFYFGQGLTYKEYMSLLPVFIFFE